MKATLENRNNALAFLNRIDARGGTELATGIKEAAAMLKDSGGDVFILTDGQVFATEDILALARATGCRLHSLGIGSASQDRFLALLSRETNGISRFVTPRERVDSAALELFAQVATTVATEVRVSKIELSGGTVSPDPVNMAFAGTPVLLFGDCDAHATGNLTVEFQGANGAETRLIVVGKEDNANGETQRLLRGSRLITDAESHFGADSARESQRWNDFLSRLSEQYSLASRAMSLVAVIERAADKPGAPPKTRIVPVGMPQDMQFEGVFASPAMPTFAALSISKHMMRQTASVDYADRSELCMQMPSEADSEEFSITSMPEINYEDVAYEPVAAQPPDEDLEDFDRLMDLAIRLESDGGMPGRNASDRILASLLTLLAFLAEGHDQHSGPFRVHIKRMMDYLDSALPTILSQPEHEIAQRVLKAIHSGRIVSGNWLELATAAADAKGTVGQPWEELDAAFA